MLGWKNIKQDLQRHLRSGPYYPKYLHGFDQPINSQAEQTGAMQASNKRISPVLVLGKATGCFLAIINVNTVLFSYYIVIIY